MIGLFMGKMSCVVEKFRVDFDIEIWFRSGWTFRLPIPQELSEDFHLFWVLLRIGLSLRTGRSFLSHSRTTCVTIVTLSIFVTKFRIQLSDFSKVSQFSMNVKSPRKIRSATSSSFEYSAISDLPASRKTSVPGNRD